VRLIHLINHRKAVKILLFLFCKPVRQRLNEQKKNWYDTHHWKKVRIEEFDVNLVKIGQGPVVFMNHGWNSWAYNLRNIAQKIADSGYSVVIPDMPAHGLSSGKIINQIEAGRVVARLLLALDKEQQIHAVVTHSWGGTATMLALDMLQKRGFSIVPEKVVCINPPLHSMAIKSIFGNKLGLTAKLKESLDLELGKIAMSDQRTLNQAFPIAFDELFETTDTEWTIIHDSDDEVIPVEGSQSFAQKYYAVELLHTLQLGHCGVLKSDLVFDLVVGQLRKGRVAVDMDGIYRSVMVQES
jgi:pimeloyl-ACP methyl ester carboxylesterase